MDKNAIFKNATNPFRRLVKYYAPHIFPFILLGLFIYSGPLLNISKTVLYPLQTIVIATILICFWKIYQEEIRFVFDWTAIIAGVVVFLIWVLPEGLYPQIGNSEFNPYDLASGEMVFLLIAFRLFGAAIVIPFVEEIFWRSFALRFLVESRFKSVPLGQFSWFSFVVVSVAFGFEHHRWLAGIVAGVIYAAVLYRTKNLFSPILAHAVTNFLLGVYVMATGKWYFW